MARNDVHRPGAIIPADYRYVAQEVSPILSLGDAVFMQAERAMIRRDMDRTGGTYSGHEHGGNCGVCGNSNAIYTHLFHHAPSNTYVRMGADCAQKCEMSIDDESAERFRRSVRDARKNVAGKAKAAAILTDAGHEQAWTIYANGNTGGKYEEGIVFDIVSKLVRFGSISPRQMSFIGGLLDKIATRPAREAQRAAERAAAQPAPTGRVEVSGEIVSTKVVATDFGDTIKMLVKTDAGWKLWATLPSAVNVTDSLRGSRITIRATVEPSKDDPTFAFGKRPSLISLQPAA